MKTTNNWLWSNYLDVASGLASRFVVQYRPYQFKPMDFKTAAEYTARLIWSTYLDRQLYVGLSGGGDSEFVVRLFTELGIPFAPIIVKTDGNQVDVNNAIDICAELEMTPFIIRTTSKDIIDYYIRHILPNRSDGLNHVHQMLVVEKAAELGGVAILGETNIYDPNPSVSIVKAFKFLPDLIYSDVIPFYYHTLELTYAEMKEVSYGETSAAFKSRVRGTKFREKAYPIYNSDDIEKYRQGIATLNQQWLEYGMGTPEQFVKQMEYYIR